MRPDHAAAQRLAGKAPPRAAAFSLATIRRSLQARCVAAAGWFGRHMERRRSHLALLEMSDEQLKDIGLSRGQAYSEFKRRL